MTVAETSIQTLHELRKTNELTHQEGEVLEALLQIDYFPTRNELKQEELSDWEKSTISGRVNGLVEKGYVEELPKREDKFNGRKSKVLMPLEDKIREEVL
jgi:DNA-binding MarR family transcriptional regulator